MIYHVKMTSFQIEDYVTLQWCHISVVVSQFTSNLTVCSTARLTTMETSRICIIPLWGVSTYHSDWWIPLTPPVIGGFSHIICHWWFSPHKVPVIWENPCHNIIMSGQCIIIMVVLVGHQPVVRPSLWSMLPISSLGIVSTLSEFKTIRVQLDQMEESC